jgi:hypothetical protein
MKYFYHIFWFILHTCMHACIHTSKYTHINRFIFLLFFLVPKHLVNLFLMKKLLDSVLNIFNVDCSVTTEYFLNPEHK